MKMGRYYLSTGFIRTAEGTRHLLVALHRNWRFTFVRPAAKPEYRRIYVGPIEIEWSRSVLSASSREGER